jgi:hypothetical protein
MEKEEEKKKLEYCTIECTSKNIEDEPGMIALANRYFWFVETRSETENV